MMNLTALSTSSGFHCNEIRYKTYSIAKLESLTAITPSRLVYISVKTSSANTAIAYFLKFLATATAVSAQKYRILIF